MYELLSILIGIVYLSFTSSLSVYLCLNTFNKNDILGFNPNKVLQVDGGCYHNLSP